MGSVILAGNDAGQSSVQDWQAAMAAGGFRVMGSSYAQQTATDHSPVGDDLNMLIEKSTAESAKTAVEQSIKK
jgi:hypothetical protein